MIALLLQLLSMSQNGDNGENDDVEASGHGCAFIACRDERLVDLLEPD
jgi:hypothetical protein